MFEEFSHFFQDEFFDLYINGEIFLEAYSKKEENRVNKFLKENKFKEDPSLTTDEEKRKGYRRGTIETDILDETGKKRRVPFELSPHPNQDRFRVAKGHFSGKTLGAGITISKQTAAKKPRIASHTFKHEEGHAAVFFDKDKQKYGIELKAIEKEIMGFCKEYNTKLYHIFNRHDMKPEEVFADRYAMKHSKYGGDKIKMPTGETFETVGFIYEIISDFTKLSKKQQKSLKYPNGAPRAEYLDEFFKFKHDTQHKLFKAESKLSIIEHKLDSISMEIDHTNELTERFNKFLVDSLKGYKVIFENIANETHFIESCIDDVNNNEFIKHMGGVEINAFTSERELSKILKMFDENCVNKCSKAFDDFVHKKVEQALNDSPSKWASSIFLTTTWATDDAESSRHYAKQDISRIIETKNELSKTRSALKDLNAYIDKLNKNISDNHKKQDVLYKAQREYIISIKGLKSKIEHLKSILKELDQTEKSKTMSDSRQEMQKSMDKLNSVINREMKSTISTLARSLLAIEPEKRAEIIKMDKASTLDGSGSFSEKNVKGDKYYGFAEKSDKNIQESYGPNDDTSGTSDFDKSNDNDPDDCYCEFKVDDDHISSKEELDEFYRRLKDRLGQEDLVQEGAKLSAKDRNKLPDSAFALVYKDASGKTIRKYPVHKKENVISAGHLFPRGVPLKYRKQVATRILREAHGYGIDTSGWNSVNAAAGKDKK